MTESKSSILDKLPPLQISSPSSASTSTSASATTQSASSSSSFPLDRSVWHTLLSRASRRHVGVTPLSTLIVLGDSTSGKSSLLSKFSDRIASSSLSSSSSSIINNSTNNSNENSVSSSSSSSREYLLDYSFCNVKNRSNADKDEILSQMNIWQLDDSNHSNMINTFLRAARDREARGMTGGSAAPSSSSLSASTPPSSTAPLSSPSSSSSPYSSAFSSSSAEFASLDSSLFLICVDISEPWKSLENLNKWLVVLNKFRDSVWSKLSPQDQKKLSNKISIDVQSYHNEELKNAIANAAANGSGTVTANGESSNPSTSPSSSSSSPDDVLSSLLPDVPQINLGFPLVIVGTKADSFSRHLQSKSGLNIDERMEFLVRRMRQIALNYGASLFFTAAAGRGPGTNVELLQNYIYHRMYKFNMAAAMNTPKAVATEDDFALFIPSGFDSKNLIDSISSKFTDDTPFDEVFKAPQSKSSKTVNKSASESVKAQDNNLFFKNLKFSLENGVGMGGGGGQNIGVSSTKSVSGNLSVKSDAGKSSTTSTSSSPSILSPVNASSSATSSSPSTSSSATSTSSSAAAAAAAVASGGSKMNPKGQQAVKQFFKNLLNSNPAAPAATTEDPKTVRANAEKELRKMTQQDGTQQ